MILTIDTDKEDARTLREAAKLLNTLAGERSADTFPASRESYSPEASDAADDAVDADEVMASFFSQDADEGTPEAKPKDDFRILPY